MPGHLKLERRIERLRTKHHATQKALKLQKKEYERRLEDLNHEAQRLKTMQSQSVSRELFDAKIDELRRWHDTMNVRMAAWSGAGATLAFMMNWFFHKP